MTHDVTIRMLRPDDEQSVRMLILSGLGQRFGIAKPELNPDLDAIYANYVAAGESFIVAEQNGRIVGSGALIREKGSVHIGRIVRVSVAAESQGQGIGRKISRYLINMAATRGFNQLLIETNSTWESALKLYKSLGFQEVSRRVDPDFGYTEVHMQLSLAPPPNDS